MRRLKTLLILAVLLWAAIPALAAGPFSNVPWLKGDQYSYEPEQLPVAAGEALTLYLAPYKEARFKQRLLSDGDVTVIAQIKNRQWLWIRYAREDGQYHTAWLRRPDAELDADFMEPALTPLRLTQPLTLADEPGGQTLCLLAAGTEITELNRFPAPAMDQEWVYAEVLVDGQPLWGFVPDRGLEEIPTWHMEGDTLYVHNGVTILGGLWLGNLDESEESESILADFRPGDRRCKGLFADEMDDDLYPSLRYIVLPETLRVFGDMSMYGLNLAELRLPGCIREVCSQESLYAMNIDRLILASDFRGTLPGMDETTIGGYAVEPGNPLYRAVDGVLFDAEMKTLLRYPHGATAEHYDVPRGVERIADFAFDSDDQNSPLKTISLPIGLREIGEYAFYALGRLNSVTIPPTVTRLAETAFGGCVSLERVSLPDGLEVKLSSWGKPGDFTYYNGDNGTTGADMGTAADPHIYAYALLASEDGSPVPVYADAYTDHPLRYLPNGITVVLNSSENGRCRAHPEDEYRNRFWVDIRFLQLINPDEAEDE